METTKRQMEGTIMASVRMSKALRENILDNFSIQCKTAYANNAGLGDFLKSIHQDILPSTFLNVLTAYAHYEKALKEFATAEQLTKNKYGGSYEGLSFPSFPVAVVPKLYFVMNTKRPLSENRTQISEWQIAIESWEKDGENIESINYVDGDFPLAVSVSDIGVHPCSSWGEDGLGLPVLHKPSSRSWWNMPPEYKDRLLSLINPIVISDPKDYKSLQSLAEGDVKTTLAKQKMSNYLNSLTTLKQFIDNWPGAIDLIPQEYIERHNKKPPRVTSANAKVNPASILPDELKSDINTAIFENKLIGDV